MFDMFGSEGGFIIRAVGNGPVVFGYCGKVMTQTRNPNELLGWISAAVGTGYSSPAGGLVGLFNRD